MTVSSEKWVQLKGQLAFNLIGNGENSEKITMSAIAHSLSRLPRFLGHTKVRWMIAHHTLLVRDIVNQLLSSEHDRHIAGIYALLHDAHEVIMGDVPAPVKKVWKENYNFDVKEFEKYLDKRIRTDLKVPLNPPAWVQEVINEADIYALKLERNSFMASKHDWMIDEIPIPSIVNPTFCPITSTVTLTRFMMSELLHAKRMNDVANVAG